MKFSILTNTFAGQDDVIEPIGSDSILDFRKIVIETKMRDPSPREDQNIWTGAEIEEFLPRIWRASDVLTYKFSVSAVTNSHSDVLEWITVLVEVSFGPHSCALYSKMNNRNEFSGFTSLGTILASNQADGRRAVCSIKGANRINEKPVSKPTDFFHGSISRL